MRMSSNLWEALPFSVMVMMEGCTIILTIWAKTVMTNGMSPFIFVVYTHGLSSLILLLYSFISHCHGSGGRTEQSVFTWTLFIRCFLLGLTGITISQNLGFLGLSYSSPILVCAMGLMVPTFSFFLSIILRKTNLDWRSSSFQAKVSGTILSIIGAIGVELYKGEYIRKFSGSLSRGNQLQVLQKALLIFSSEPEHWVFGGVLLAASSFSVSVWNIIQKERNPSAWRLKLNMELLLIILTAIFGGIVRSHVHKWCMNMKGPYYVPMFKPFGIVFATIFGVSLSANNLHYGSVIGAVVIGIGYFSILWGETRDGGISEDQRRVDESLESSSEGKVPLLQEEMSV